MQRYALFLVLATHFARVFFSNAWECNICGCADCIIGNPRGRVHVMLDDILVATECHQLQQQVEDASLENAFFCGKNNRELSRVASEHCACQTADGIFLGSTGT